MMTILFLLAVVALAPWIFSGRKNGGPDRPYRDTDPDAMIIRDCRDRGEPLPWDPQ